MAPIVPFDSGGMIHRVATDTNPRWIAQWSFGETTNCIAQCGVLVCGAFVPRHMFVTCIPCMGRDAREIEWESTDS